MRGGIVSERYKNVYVDIFPDGTLFVYVGKTGKILVQGKADIIYETTQ